MRSWWTLIESCASYSSSRHPADGGGTLDRSRRSPRVALMRSRNGRELADRSAHARGPTSTGPPRSVERRCAARGRRKPMSRWGGRCASVLLRDVIARTSRAGFSPRWSLRPGRVSGRDSSPPSWPVDHEWLLVGHNTLAIRSAARSVARPVAGAARQRHQERERQARSSRQLARRARALQREQCCARGGSGAAAVGLPAEASDAARRSHTPRASGSRGSRCPIWPTLRRDGSSAMPTTGGIATPPADAGAGNERSPTPACRRLPAGAPV